MPLYLTAPDGSRWAVVPVEATRDMTKAGSEHEWSDGFDRDGSHAAGKYMEYTSSLRMCFGDTGAPTAASESYAAMLQAAPAFPTEQMVEKVAMTLCDYYDALPESATYIERKSSTREIIDREEARLLARAVLAALFSEVK